MSFLPAGIYQLITYPSEILYQFSSDCTEADLPLIQETMKPMMHIMKAHNGIGLSGIQVGIPKRFCVMLTKGTAPKSAGVEDLAVIINPTLVEEEAEKVIAGEGCLSLPMFNEQIERPKQVTIAYRDMQYIERKAVFEGLEARCILHEMDHMEGVIQLSKVGPMKQEMYKKKLQKNRKYGKITV